MSAKLAGFLLRTACSVFTLSLVLAVPLRAQGRVVAIGDVHGAYEDFVSILQRTGLIDASHHWAGGATVFVQTGDIPDRGTKTREALDLLMQLEQEAVKQNGKVIPLLGNHEAMNMMGDLRYVSPEDYQDFSTQKSEAVREEAYRDYRKFPSVQRGHRGSISPDDEAARQKWMAEHPPGFFERYEAFGTQGVYGRWLREHDAVAQVGDVLFVHGGLDPKLHFRSIRELNNRVHSELKDFDNLWHSLSEKKIIWRYMTLAEAMTHVQEELAANQSGDVLDDPDAIQKMQQLLRFQSWLIAMPDGPLWYRGLAMQPEDELMDGLEKMLARLKVRYVVAGHTVMREYDVTPRFDNHVFLIDTGMLKPFFGGRASALEIQKGGFTAYYADGDQKVLLAPPAGEAIPAHGQGAANLKPEL